MTNTAKRTGLILILCFVSGLLLSLLYSNRSELFALTMKAYETRYRVMTNQQQDHERFYVYHNNPTDITRFGEDDSSVVRVEPTLFNRLTVIDMLPNSNATLERLRQISSVDLVVKSDLPLFCH